MRAKVRSFIQRRKRNARRRWSELREFVRPLWIPALLTLTTFAAITLLPLAPAIDASSAARWCGLAFQIAGLLVILAGLMRSRALFGKPRLMAVLREWGARGLHIFILRKPHALNAHGVSTLAPVFSKAYLRAMPSKDAPLEERVDFLFSELDNQDRRFAELDQRLDQFPGLLAGEARQREADISAVDKKIEEAAIGGIHLELVGLTLLFFGIVATSIPDELAAAVNALF